MSHLLYVKLDISEAKLMLKKQSEGGGLSDSDVSTHPSSVIHSFSKCSLSVCYVRVL